jgi:Calcineurin-like phosphoesterase
VRRHLIVPDTQCRPGVDTSHIDWAAQAIVDYKPDVVIHLGDHWDLPSLNGHNEPGSLEIEGARYSEDIEVGDEAFERLSGPMEAEQARLVKNKQKHWDVRKVFLRGNHENRADRLAAREPKWQGVIGSHNFNTRDWEVHEFLKIVEIDGISYSHYFGSGHSSRPIGGSVENRLARVGRSFVMGHQQGLLYGIKQYPGSIRRHGIVAGSFYLHDESYRGPQGNNEWRGIVVLNEVKDGDYDVMPLSMSYLRRKYS